MTPKTLKEIKQSIAKLAKVYEILVDTWNGQLEHGDKATYPVMIWVNVILHNLAFDGSKCVGYSHEKAVNDLEIHIKALKALNEYEHQCYITHFPCNEVVLIYEGETMSESYQ